jgi:hypothetical protein
MNVAASPCGTSWTFADVRSSGSSDLLCHPGGEVLHVQVKGHHRSGTDVVITPDEVGHARDRGHSALFILSGITCRRSHHGVPRTWRVSGGQAAAAQHRRVVSGEGLPAGVPCFTVAVVSWSWAGTGGMLVSLRCRSGRHGRAGRRARTRGDRPGVRRWIAGRPLPECC